MTLRLRFTSGSTATGSSPLFNCAWLKVLIAEFIQTLESRP